MNSTRIISFTLCLGLACLLMMGNALAGTTEAAEVKYAREVGGAGTQYVIPERKHDYAHAGDLTFRELLHEGQP